MDAEQDYKTESGQKFHRSDYFFSEGPPSEWKLRKAGSPGAAPDAGHVGAAIAALGKGFRGNKVELPSGALASVKARVRAAWRKLHPDKGPDEMPDVLKASADLFAPGAIHVPQYQGSGPPGWDAVVDELKQDASISNPYAMAWYLKQRGVELPTQATQELFAGAVNAAKAILREYGLPGIAAQAALGDAWAQAVILTPDAGFYVHTEGR